MATSRPERPGHTRQDHHRRDEVAKAERAASHRAQEGRLLVEVRRFDHRSRVAILGHPIHPMLIPFPIALLTAALVSDIAAAGTGDIFWVRASIWLLLGGWVTGVLAALTGIIELFAVPKARKVLTGYLHAATATPAIILAIVNWSIRSPDGTATSMGLRITLSVVMVALLMLAGALGGHLVFRHRIGVTPARDEAVNSRGRC